eukprot:m.134921 g.134921  ORF g.134921 m.134921 type:complete len:335 (-) comp17555_c0_seq32:1875-2879(-)
MRNGLSGRYSSRTRRMVPSVETATRSTSTHAWCEILRSDTSMPLTVTSTSPTRAPALCASDPGVTLPRACHPLCATRCTPSASFDRVCGTVSATRCHPAGSARLPRAASVESMGAATAGTAREVVVAGGVRGLRTGGDAGLPTSLVLTAYDTFVRGCSLGFLPSHPTSIVSAPYAGCMANINCSVTQHGSHLRTALGASPSAAGGRLSPGAPPEIVSRGPDCTAPPSVGAVAVGAATSGRRSPSSKTAGEGEMGLVSALWASMFALRVAFLRRGRNRFIKPETPDTQAVNDSVMVWTTLSPWQRYHPDPHQSPAFAAATYREFSPCSARSSMPS